MYSDRQPLVPEPKLHPNPPLTLTANQWSPWAMNKKLLYKEKKEECEAELSPIRGPRPSLDMCDHLLSGIPTPFWPASPASTPSTSSSLSRPVS